MQVYQICGIIEQIKNRCWSTGTTITYCYKDAVRIRIQRFLVLYLIECFFDKNNYINSLNVLKGMAEMMDIQFTEAEEELLMKYGISYAESMEYEEAEGVLDIADYMQEMNAEEVHIAEGIIDKITIPPDW